MPSDEEILSHLFLPYLSHLFGQIGIVKEEGDPLSSLLDRTDEKSSNSILDLQLNSSDSRTDDWLSFPHRLGYREGEPFSERLLHNNVSPSLQGVHFLRRDWL